MPITEIIAQISQAGGLARPNRFSVQIVPPRIFANSSLSPGDILNTQARTAIFDQANALGVSPQSLGLRNDWFQQMNLSGINSQSRLDFMCTRGELPGKAFSASDVRTYGSYFKMPYIDTYADVTFHFIVGRDMFERHFFDAWSYTIQDPETADFNYVDEYATTVDIYQMDETDQATYGCRLFQCWPVAIGQLTLDCSERNTFHFLPITFTYRKWVNLRVNSGTPTSIESGGGSPQNFEETLFPSGKQ